MKTFIIIFFLFCCIYGIYLVNNNDHAGASYVMIVAVAVMVTDIFLRGK